MNHAVICVSIGKRPWTKYTFDAMERYAKNINSDFIIESECNYKSVNNFENKFINVGRPNKKGYIAKALVVEKYLKKYDRIAVIDDSYIIKSNADNLFELIPESYLGFNPELHMNLKKGKPTPSSNVSFEYIKKYIKENNLNEINYDWTKYANSSLVLYDRSHIEYFSQDYIFNNLNLFNCRQPHQSFLYYTCAKFNIKQKEIPQSFHIIPGIWEKLQRERSVLTSGKSYINLDGVNGVHYTGTYKHRESLLKEAHELWINN